MAATSLSALPIVAVGDVHALVDGEEEGTPVQEGDIVTATVRVTLTRGSHALPGAFQKGVARLIGDHTSVFAHACTNTLSMLQARKLPWCAASIPLVPFLWCQHMPANMPLSLVVRREATSAQNCVSGCMGTCCCAVLLTPKC